MTEQSQAANEENPRRVRKMGPSFEIELSLTSKGLRKSTESAWGAADFYLFFIESDAGGAESKIRELRDGIKQWRAGVEDLIEKWNAAADGMQTAIANSRLKVRDNGEPVCFECHTANAVLLVDLYAAGDRVLMYIRLLEILSKVDAEAAHQKKHEIRAQVGKQLREISRLFRIAIVRLNDVKLAKKSSAENEDKSEREETALIDFPDADINSTVEADE